MKLKSTIHLLLLLVTALILAACGNDANSANADGKTIRAAIDTAAGGRSKSGQLLQTIILRIEN